MHVQSHWGRTARARGLRSSMIAAFVASFVALLAAIPTGSAVASPTPATATSTEVGLSLGELNKVFPESELNTVLSNLPVADLNTEQLAKELALVPGLKGLVGEDGLTLAKLETALKEALGKLPGNATLGELTSKTGLLTQLETTLTNIPVVGPLLKVLLGTKPTLLSGSLGSLDLYGLVGPILSSTKEPIAEESLSKLLAKLLEGLKPAELESVLGGASMTGGFVPKTVQSVSETLGSTVESVKTALEPTTGTLKSTTEVLTAPLDNGKLLTLLDGLAGLKLTLLGATTETGSGGNGGSGGSGGSGSGGSGGSGSGGEGSSGGSGSNGGSGGSGSSTPGGASVIVNLPAAAVATPASTPAGTTPKAVGKIKILSHKVKGHVATLVLQIPAAGKVVVSGGGVRAIGKGATRSERLTVRIPLSKADTASLRKHRNRLSVVLKASFTPTSGISSSAGVTVHFA